MTLRIKNQFSVFSYVVFVSSIHGLDDGNSKIQYCHDELTDIKLFSNMESGNFQTEDKLLKKAKGYNS